MSKALYEAITEDLAARAEWQDRQAIYYDMRHDGLPRKFKPFPAAADLHYPLIDSMIEKHKPFYFQLIFGPEMVATFISMQEQFTNQAMAVSQWFDYKVRHQTNLQVESLITIDNALMTGRGVIKVFWDTNKKKVRYEAIDPTYFIVPWTTRDLQETDRCCHVQQYTKESYSRKKEFNKDPDFVKRICGRTVYGSDEVKSQEKATREGINIPRNDNQIIVWEAYTQGEGGRWKVEWFSPNLPDEPVRPAMNMVYEHGQLCFVDFPMEIKDPGFYSPRGIPDKAKHDEAYMTKVLNEKADSLTFFNRPIYTSDGQIPNPGNIKLMPGTIIPQGLKRVEPGTPPVGLDQELTAHRMMSEYHIGMPDFGVGQELNTSSRRTKYELEQVSGMMGQNMDLRGKIFKISLERLFVQTWGLYRQFDRQSLQYWVNDQSMSLSSEAMGGEYAIMPNGTAEAANKSYLIQKAGARMQMFTGNPFINQGELAKSVLELDDPRLVKRLYVEPADKGYDQAEEQADEIGNILNGFPVKRSQTDDDMAHVMTLVQFVEMRAAKRDAIPPEAAALMLKHGGEHTQAILDSKNQQTKDAFKQVRPRVEGAVGFLAGLIKASQGQGGQINPMGTIVPKQGNVGATQAVPEAPEPAEAQPALETMQSFANPAQEPAQ